MNTLSTHAYTLAAQHADTTTMILAAKSRGGHGGHGGGGLMNTFVHSIVGGAGASIGWRIVSMLGLPMIILIAVVAIIWYVMKNRSNRDD